jgi:hypothetical protein
MAKLTEEELRKLVQEEIDSLSEEELNEFLPAFTGLGKGIKKAAKGALKGYREGRAEAVKAKLQKKYGNKIVKMKNNAEDILNAAKADINRQRDIYPNELAKSTSLDKIIANLEEVVTDLETVENAFSARQQAVSEDDSQGSEE